MTAEQETKTKKRPTPKTEPKEAANKGRSGSKRVQRPKEKPGNMTDAEKAGGEDSSQMSILMRIESRMESNQNRMESRMESNQNRIEDKQNRIEDKQNRIEDRLTGGVQPTGTTNPKVDRED